MSPHQQKQAIRVANVPADIQKRPSWDDGGSSRMTPSSNQMFGRLAMLPIANTMPLRGYRTLYASDICWSAWASPYLRLQFQNIVLVSQSSHCPL